MVQFIFTDKKTATPGRPDSQGITDGGNLQSSRVPRLIEPDTEADSTDGSKSVEADAACP